MKRHMSADFVIVMYKDRPELAENLAEYESDSYPKFIEEDPVWAQVAPAFYKEFADFQFFIVDKANDKLVAIVNNVPFTWDDNPDHLPGYHQMLVGALADWRTGKTPNTLSLTQVIVNPEFRGQGISDLVEAQIRLLAREQGMSHINTALRPTLKDQYPLHPIEEYAQWRRQDGELFDPWLRNWERRGAEFIKVEPESTVIEATVEQWESWTGLAYPVSGEYWLPGGLSTLTIDRENNIGRHCEPHVWVRIPFA